MTTSKRERTLAVTTAILIVFVVMFSRVIKPQLKHRRQLLKQQANIALLATQTQANLYLKNHIEKKHDLAKPLTVSDRTEDQEVSDFFRKMRQLCEKQNLMPKSENKLPTLHRTSHKVLSFHIVLQGNVNQILRFIRSLEVSEMPIDIIKCEVKAQESRDIVQVSLNINKIITES